MTQRHCDPVTMDHIIELRKRVALLEKQLENALSYVRPMFEQQRKYLDDQLETQINLVERAYSTGFSDAMKQKKGN